jgi:hypothetical protein
MSEPKREDYPTDAEFIDAQCKHYGIPNWMTKELPEEVYELAARAWEEIRKSKGNVITAEPKRFELIADKFGDGDMAEDPKGNYVLMQDYSFLRKEAQSLKEEVDRLKSILRQTDRLLLIDGEFEAYSVGTLERANAKLERLIKAGDEFVSLLEYEEYDMESAGIKDMVDAWNAAKNLNS